MLLEIKNCSLSFGGIQALKNFSADLQATELLGEIGPNGAGKTTLFNVLTGVYQPDEGEIRLGGSSLLGKLPHQINEMGMARTFQNIRLFKEMTVEENVLVASHHRIRSSLLALTLRRKNALREEEVLTKQAFGLLDMFSLLDRRLDLAKNLPYGDQRKLEIVRALVTLPKVLLLDEPAAGMNVTEKKELMHLILRIQSEFGIAILLIEHDMSFVMSLCPRLIVLDYGLTIAEGTPEEVRKNPRVIEAYLGEKVRINSLGG